MTGETIVVVRLAPGGVDQYGDPVASTESRTTVEGCALAPRMSDELNTRGRQGVIVGLTLYAPPGADILHTDHIEARDQTWEVDGEVGDWRNPYTGEQPGLEVALKRVAG